MDYFSLLQNNHLISLDYMFQPYAMTPQNKEKIMLLISSTLYTLLYIYTSFANSGVKGVFSSGVKGVKELSLPAVAEELRQ